MKIYIRNFAFLLGLLCLAGCQASPSASEPNEPKAESAGADKEAQRRAHESLETASTTGADLSRLPKRLAEDKIPAQTVQVPLALSRTVEADYPVSSGVPFPRGAATSLAHLRLIDGNGAGVPAQFKGLARWPDGSYKSVLVSFVTPAAERVSGYELLSGPDISPEPSPSPLKTTDGSEAIDVVTGPMRFTVNKKRFSVFEGIWVDSDGDGAFSDAEALLREPGDIFLVDADSGAEFRARNDKKPSVEVVESGPVRIVIRASGSLTADNGRTLTDYIVWITAYAGQDFARLDYTLVDTREEKDVEAERKKLPLAVAAYGIRLPYKLDGGIGMFSGENGTVLQGPATGNPYLFQDGEMNFVDGNLGPFAFYNEGVSQGAKADGWVDASDGRAGLAVFVRKFWQQFPKELALKDGTLIVSLHPARASGDDPEVRYPPLDLEGHAYRRPKTFYFPREGGAKTYQLLFQFHKGAGDWKRLRGLARALDEPPRLLAPVEWYASTGVFGLLLPSITGATEGYDSWLMDGMYGRSIGSKIETGGLAMLYGWRDYGDRMRPGWAGDWEGVKIPGFYNDTHVGAHIYFLQYLRTLDDAWWELGEMATRHTMDIDVSHANRIGYWKDWKGKPVGFGPGELHGIKHEMIDHDSRNVHKGHAHLSGLADYYLLTGDPRAWEVMNEMGTWWKRAAPVLFGTPIGKPHWAEAERDFAWPLFTLNEAYRGTGNPEYMEGSAQIVRHLIEWWQQPSDHYVNGQVVGHNDWTKGTGWWAMYPKQDNSPEPPRGKTLYNGTNPWMAGPLISALIQFWEYDRDTKLVDAGLVQEMMLQTMNFVVKYGWEAEKRYFVYSEAARDTGGNSNLVVYPLAYLGRLARDTELAHPEWYDTSDQWLEIAWQQYNDWKTPRDRETSDLGFYGYELVFPTDFFAVMYEMENGRLPWTQPESPLGAEPASKQPASN